MDLYGRLLMKAFENDWERLEWLMAENVVVSKTAKASENARKRGNDLYLQKHHSSDIHREVFKYYCNSVMNAPLKSEPLALALGNRSAFLLHIQKYEECICDIDKAVKITESNELKVKLLCRKIECLKKLGWYEYQQELDEIDIYINEMNNNKSKTQSMILLETVKAYPVTKEKTTNAYENDMNLNKCLPKINNILDQIDVKYNEKYGRYIVAAKDYKPGDIIFTEDLYATTILNERIYISCHYCFKTAWAGIPCDECVWAIFCSEDCKEKAWTEFHDIECFMYFYMILNMKTINFHLSLRLLIRGLKECGNITKLKQELESVDASKDAVRKGFYEDGKLSSQTIRSIYSLKGDGLHEGLVEIIAEAVPSILIGLARCRRLPEIYRSEKLKDLVMDDDLMFLGELLIKLTAVYNLNAFGYASDYVCEVSDDLDTCEEDSCCQRAVCLAPFASLINHSCFPNASRFFTDDRKIVMYAMHPIKKNSQIFITYFSGFYIDPLSERRFSCSKYGFECNCKPCLEAWPPVLDEKYKSIRSSTEEGIFKPCESIISRVKDNAEPIQYDKRTVELLSKAISEAFRSLEQPSYLTCLLVTSLNLYYARTLCFRPESFGDCDKFSKRKISFETRSLKDKKKIFWDGTTIKIFFIIIVVIILIVYIFKLH